LKYDKLGKLTKDFEPYKNLWITTSDWLRWFESWMNDPISSIDAENIDRNANDAYKTMHKAIKQFQDLERKYYFQIIITLKKKKNERKLHLSLFIFNFYNQKKNTIN
jgi:hypothetical protein